MILYITFSFYTSIFYIYFLIFDTEKKAKEINQRYNFKIKKVVSLAFLIIILNNRNPYFSYQSVIRNWTKTFIKKIMLSNSKRNL